MDDDCNGQVDELGTTTCGVGACATTVSLCGANGVNTCTPGTPAAGPDGCDGVDNDCDGAVDEDCAACIHVAPTGDDAAALADQNATPFLTVQAAIDFAAARPDIATRVCVAPGAACGATATFLGPSNTDLTMRDGIDVLGGYESTTFTRCTTSTTHLAPQTGKGVLFPASITAGATLDGFTIDRYTSGTSTRGITVDGAQAVTLSNLSVPRASVAIPYAYGVTLANGADALIFKSSIQGGYGSTESAALSSAGATVALEDSTLSFDDGVSSPYGVVEHLLVLEDSPGSSIERSTLGGRIAFNNYGTVRTDAIVIHGDATATILRHNTISTQVSGNTKAAAVLAVTDCAGASPWIGDNIITPTGSGSPQGIDAVYAAGDCKPVLDSNPSIVITVGTQTTTAVHCGALSGVSSGCVISKNPDIGAVVSFPGSISQNNATGIACDDGSCSRIDRNVVAGIKQSTYSGSPAHYLYGQGVALGSSPALVERNSIAGIGSGMTGCNIAGYGLAGGSASARIQNNQIYGARNVPVSTCMTTNAIYGLVSSAAQVYSNHLVAWPSSTCMLNATPSPGSGNPKFYGLVMGAGGEYRNNAIEGCAGVKEANASAEPSVFENNAFSGGYLDEGADYPTGSTVPVPETRIFAVQVNALTDMTSANNIDGTCYAAGSDTLAAGSACIDAGTPNGAPTFDYDGQPRDSAPDIGSDEYMH